MDRTRKREAGPGLELIKKGPSPPRKPAANHIALLTRLSRGMRTREWSPRTEEAYLGWIRRFLNFYSGRNPKELGRADVNHYLSYLANERVTAHTSALSEIAARIDGYLSQVTEHRDVEAAADVHSQHARSDPFAQLAAKWPEALLTTRTSHPFFKGSGASDRTPNGGARGTTFRSQSPRVTGSPRCSRGPLVPKSDSLPA